MKIIINPKNYKQKYLAFLNNCFKNWGSEKEYDWYFNNNDKKADIFILENETNDVLAGTAITYRQITYNNKIIDIGILTGSWTLPIARGKGCFTEIVERSKDICSTKKINYLTAFVMESNPSYRRLKAAGSYLLESFSLFSPIKQFKSIDDNVEIEKDINKALFSLYNHQCNNTKTHFHYNSLEQFKQQYFLRINSVMLIKVNNDYALIEETHNTFKILYASYDSLQDLIHNLKTISNWTLSNNNKNIFFYTTDKQISVLLKENEFNCLLGFFTILNSNSNLEVSNQKIFSNLNINIGDKM